MSITNHATPTGLISADEIALLLKRVEQTDAGCWLWSAGRINNGGPTFWLRGRSVQARRISYMAFVGSLPDRGTVENACRDPACIAPAHLFSYIRSQRPTLSAGERFLSRFLGRTRPGPRPDDCWEWLGALASDGYGHMWAFSRLEYAHRISFHLFREPHIPPGALVLHSCDNPPCTNPAHLFLGTNADNARDREAKGRGGNQPLVWRRE